MSTALSADERNAPLEEISRHRRPDIQGLRALAVLMVVAFHADLPIPGGFAGVDVFFVISGFVITAMLHREHERSGRIDLTRFYVRRLKRLAPALALMTTIVVFVSAIVLSPFGGQATVARTALGATLFVANFVISIFTGGYFENLAESNPLLNTWSLSVEEQFYFVFPGLLVLSWLLARRSQALRAAPIVLVSLVALLSFGLTLAGSANMTFPGSSVILGFYSPFTRAWEFAVGALLALVIARRQPKVPQVTGYLGLVLLAASLWLISDDTAYPGLWTMLPVSAALLLILAGGDSLNRVSRFLSVRPLVKVGDWSYSIYLWHWPFIVFAALIWPNQPTVLLLAAAASFVPAVASYRWVESPIRFTKLGNRRQALTLLGVVILVPATCAVALAFSSRATAWLPGLVLPKVAAFTEGHRPHEAWSRCLSQATMAGPTANEVPWGSCVWGEDREGQPIYLVGDSNAGMLAEALQGAAAQSRSPLLLDTAASCPLVDWQLSDRTRAAEAANICRRHSQEVLTNLESAKPGTVVIANTDGYLMDDNFSAAEASGNFANDRIHKLEVWESGLRNVVKRLQTAGHAVVVVKPIHAYLGANFWDPAYCTVFMVASDGCEASLRLNDVEAMQADSRSILDAIASDQNVGLVDLRPYLCEGDTCSTARRDGSTLYADYAHLSVPASAALAPVFHEAIKASVGRTS